MKPNLRKFLQWLPFPILWIALWGVIVYFLSGSGSQENEAAANQQFDLIRISIFFLISVGIGFFRHSISSNDQKKFRLIPISTSDQDLYLLTNQPWSRYLPEIVAGIFYFSASLLLSNLCPIPFIFGTSFFFFVFIEFIVQYHVMKIHSIPNRPQPDSPPQIEPTQMTSASKLPETISSKPSVDQGSNSDSEPVNESLLSNLSLQELESEPEQEEEWEGQLTIFCTDSSSGHLRWVWIHRWEPDQTKLELHLPFCPIFDRTPEVSVEIVDGPGEIQVRKTLVQGTHLTLKRPSSTQEVSTTFIATAANQ